MYGRIVLDIEGDLFDEPLREGQGAGRRRRRRRRSRPRRCAELCRASTSRSCERETGKPFPQEPRRPAPGRDRGRVQLLERRPGRRLPRARAHQPRPRHRRQRADHGVRQPRRQLGHRRRASPATPPPGENEPYGDFLVNAQGEDVVAGIRNTEDLDAPEARTSRRSTPSCSPSSHRLEHALPGHVRHRVHDRAGQALDAPDPRRQAHRRGGAAHGRRHDQGPPHQAARGRRPSAGHGRPPRPGAAPAVRGPATSR